MSWPAIEINAVFTKGAAMVGRAAWIHVAAVAALLAVAACTQRSADRPGEQRGVAATQPVPVELEAGELARVQGISVGRADAPVVIYEFADFQCPACAQFALIVTPYIKEQHVEPGRVRYVHYDFPLIQIHEHAFLASRAGRCAHEQGRFWEYHDLLYAEQRDWSPRDQDEVLPLYIDYAEGIGLDRTAFEGCLRSDRHAAEVSKNMRLGQSLGVPGTPTLFINGRRAEIRSLEQLDQLILQEAGG
jgi:protein-disulfide isomerase